MKLQARQSRVNEMTGQILNVNKSARKNTYHKGKQKLFEDLIFFVSEALFETKYHGIKRHINNISSDEINWASSYLLETYTKLKNDKYSEALIYKYIVTKVIAILSLWAGYISEGGTSPPPLEMPPPLNTDWNFKKSSKDKDSLRCTVIIPSKLNYNNQNVLKLSADIISPILKSKYVKQVIFIGSINNKSFNMLNDTKIALIEIDDEKDSPAYSRNVGIEESLSLNSDVTMFMDDDIIIKTPKTIDELTVKAYDVGGIVSPLVESIGTSWLDAFHNYDGTLNGVYYRKNDKYLLYATTCCMAVSNEILTSEIRFDNDFRVAAGEDIDFSLKALYKGFPIVALDDMIIHHDYRYQPKKEIDTFIHRYFRYGIGNFQLLKKHPYYYSLLSNAEERPTWKTLTEKYISSYPKEIAYLANKFMGGI